MRFLAFAISVIEDNILVFDVAAIAQTLAEAVHLVFAPRTGWTEYKSDPRDSCRLLRLGNDCYGEQRSCK